MTSYLITNTEPYDQDNIVAPITLCDYDVHSKRLIGILCLFSVGIHNTHTYWYIYIYIYIYIVLLLIYINR